jgi:hypothetical protein
MFFLVYVACNGKQGAKEAWKLRLDGKRTTPCATAI